MRRRCSDILARTSIRGTVVFFAPEEAFRVLRDAWIELHHGQLADLTSLALGLNLMPVYL